MHAIGIDIGGTKMAGALVDEAGNILNELKVPSPIDDSDQMIEAIGSLISTLAEGAQVVAVGVAAAPIERLCIIRQTLPPGATNR
jgi:glucokinase